MKNKSGCNSEVTICIPTYNSGKTIGETLSSLLTQTFKDFEIIVVDNCSTDNTVEIVKSFDDRRISVICNEQNIGAEANFEKCFYLSHGKYTAIFHADDVYHPEIVESEVRFLEQNLTAGAVFTRSTLIDESGKSLGLDSMPPSFCDSEGWSRTYTFKEIFKSILRDLNFLVCPSAMVRTNIYKDHVKRWNGELFGTSADLGVWLRILEKYPIGILPEPLIHYRISSSQGGAIYRYLNTGRADFFKVIDYYLTQDNVAASLTKRDREHLLFLENTDNYSRAMKCIITGNQQLAKELTKNAWKPKLLKMALITKPNRLMNRSRSRIWSYGIILYIVARAPFQKRLKELVKRIRYKN